ncbi:hypothetical protein EZV61_19175 [Corallincola luteus]|uniref:Uncharacterized protein n=1 Tax=Corallincola luteus TaxID=1775177 RepID=A0ABY2AFE7_9GAMM|nr:hypothetical protein [Corallincola luteus]TCI01132.1 hypothetical protein EZV61_19175 [Corallincola luteus]
MKKITDYIFYDSWQLSALNLVSGDNYVVLEGLCDLKANELVEFKGFSDIDNHFGKFIFVNSDGEVLEVSGDFSSQEHHRFKELKLAIKKAYQGD